MALYAQYAQYAQRIANTTPHTKSGINRLDIAFIEKTKAENAKIRNEMLNNTFVKKIITPIPTPSESLLLQCKRILQYMTPLVIVNKIIYVLNFPIYPPLPLSPYFLIISKFLKLSSFKKNSQNSLGVFLIIRLTKTE